MVAATDIELEDFRPTARLSDTGDRSLNRNRVTNPLLGAPIETTSPLGTDVHFLSAVLLPFSLMIGMGVISTPGVVVNSAGSYGMALVLWGFGALMALAGLHIYLELASRFPTRSGGDAVYLEQAYLRPAYLVSTVFAVSSILLGYSAAISATIFAQYTLHAFDIMVTPLKQKGIAVAMVTFSLGLCASSTRWSLKVMNGLGFVKIAAMAFIIGTGIAVLCGMTHIEHPLENLSHPFAGSTSNPNALATGFIKVDWTFAGWNHAVFFMSEMNAQHNSHQARTPPSDSIKIVSRASYVALSLASAIYVLVNLAFSAAVPKSTLSNSGSLVGVMFCESVYGKESFVATRLFPAMVALSCLGVMISQALGGARIVRESSRQGVLPCPEFLSSTWPFGTPGGPILIQWVLSIFVVVVSPATNQFSFLVNAQMYPSLVFAVLIALAVWILRARSAGSEPETFRASNVFVILYLAKCFFTLIMPWVPPEGGAHSGDGSMWYAMYCVIGIILLLFSVTYYLGVWVVLPHLGDYTLVLETVELKGGAVTNRFTRVPKTQIPKGHILEGSGDVEDLEPLLDKE
ncbi:hypothetical protein FRB94_011588 [Tulasnella sp. JGI-2019a]|nr:hypothetical protein FRB93_009917 [Tulasnella sp. JGI-2019a]KAG8992484.1 hypothetical protein FRB94_011588 [Tulasnella sp. JGI-2019a]KAG9024743.1 hypothetical protein FRB95_011135 [Tulasnella sp. JGI-2019a]